ncbi:hypothetical protein AJ78_04771 [Emergomyces pasteurianus Ep9510]|uniref:BRCT domain-containing protein n=1 Tax=Emergomyces pasteurianus Ep9510 TaxID=1447872 RepID=A0A1J9QG90_9EURO|nr:hypothetical protein AJ78_04771 [Emergomyces pasteurianus Ep9510]
MSYHKRPLPHSVRDILTTPSTAALETFDPWNSASTGHQVAEKLHTGATGWQQARSQKLGRQFGDDTGRGGRSTEGEWDWVSSEKYEDVRRIEGRTGDIRNLMGGVKKRRLDGGWRIEKKRAASKGGVHCGIIKGNGAFTLDDSGTEAENVDQSRQIQNISHARDNSEGRPETIKTCPPITEVEEENVVPSSTPKPAQTSLPLDLRPASASTTRGIFANLTIYINGSTYPLISDHKLKYLLVSNGANVTFALARRTVTHVILGRPNNNQNGHGAGGGLAATKLQREIQRVGGKGVKFVGVEWVLESIKAGCRLPEARFATLHMAPGNQRSVRSMFQRAS